MDGIVIIFLSLILFVVYRPKDGSESPVEEMEAIVPNPRLNPEMIHDSHAFMKIANELGFH